jgi:CheY-like chemotaxis protein
MAPRRIMMVDDEAGFTQLAKLNLEKTGKYAVRVENNPGNALDAARAFKPELILLDIVMPGKDGGEVMADLQRDNQIKGCPCIAKPISPKDLMREIETIIKEAR